MNTRRLACILALVLALAGVVAVSTALAQGSGNPADIVISEVMFNAITETNPLNCGEWVEIYNRGTMTVNLAGWGVRDWGGNTRTITADMCPENSCEIPPKGCWLIAAYTREINYLQIEFNHYTLPLKPAVLQTSTIFLGSRIGDGLANTTDALALVYTNGLAVDCVSWRYQVTGTFCASLTYLEGLSGTDTNRGDRPNTQGEHDGQSITNIEGLWYDHQRNASPYNCYNTAAGGNPAAVILSNFSARPWLRPGLILAGAVGAGAVALLHRRRSGDGRQKQRLARAGP